MSLFVHLEGQGDLVSRLLVGMEITRVVIWIVGIYRGY